MFPYTWFQTHTKIFVLAALLAGAGLLQAQVTVISDFNDGVNDWDVGTRNPGVTAVESNGHLTIRGQLPATMGALGNSIASFAWMRNGPIRDGETLETRVELIGTSRGDVMAGIQYDAVPTSDQGLYSLLKNANYIMLNKVLFSSGIPIQGTRFIYAEEAVKHTNVVLSLALTGIGESVEITIKVLDSEDDLSVLFERSFLDTPDVDSSIVAGPGLGFLGPDPGPPFTMGIYTSLPINQVTDGMQPVAEVTYDNFVYEYRNAAELTIERAVRLSWPVFDTPFVVEGAPTVEGPWTLVQEPVIQTNFMNWMTVPVTRSSSMQVFRLRENTP